MRAVKRRRVAGPTVTIHVGTGALMETFNIHETYLKQSSKFFEAALKREWKEGVTRTVALPEDDPEITSVYFDWLYSNEIASKTSDELADEQEHEREKVFLAKAYVLGEKLQDDDFCDAVMVSLTELMDIRINEISYLISDPMIKVIYNGTISGSPARRLLVDMTVQYGDKSWMRFAGEESEYVEYIRDVASAFLKEANERDPLHMLVDERSKWFKKAENASK